jgi:putative hemolysin
MIWLVIALCLLIAFVFSGIEAGILSVNRVRLKHRVKLRDPAALVLNRLLGKPERVLMTVVVVTNLMTVFAITLTTQELVRLTGPRGYLIAFAVALPIYLMGIELLPKSLFRRFPYRALAFLSTPLRLADLLLSPMHWVGSLVVRTVCKRRPPDQQKLFVAREDFKYLTIESERTGTLTKIEREMIHNVVDFRAVTARQVMVPVEKMRAIPHAATVSELLARSQSEHIERWPVLGEKGEITGLVNVFDVALDARPNARVGAFRRRIVEVTAEEPAYSIVRKLRAARTTLAAVVGSDGKPIGIVTWEDLIHRLVSTAVA